jgi:hypothetical protein
MSSATPVSDVACGLARPRDVGIRKVLVSPELPRLPWFGLFRHVAFTNPFTDRSADLRLLNLALTGNQRRANAG